MVAERDQNIFNVGFFLGMKQIAVDKNYTCAYMKIFYNQSP